MERGRKIGPKEIGVYTVVGITGNTGRTVAKTLLAEGKEVRGVVRNESKAAEWVARGVEIVVAELWDERAIIRAFEGSEGVYIMLPTYFEAEDMFAANTRDLANLKHAVTASGIQKVVFLSSIGAERANGTGAIFKLHQMEAAFSSLPVSTAAIRTGWFMENFNGLISTARETGVLPSFLNPLDLRVPMIATQDIGALAADILQQTWSGHRVIELATEQLLSPIDVAATFTSTLGRDITASIVPRNQWIATYRSWGLSTRSAEAMAEMIDGFNRKWIVFEDKKAERIVARTTLEEVLQQAVASAQA
jgi:NAD(P)H dehydrogenase (quinone)